MEVFGCAASNGEKSCDCLMLIYGLFKAFPIMDVLMCVASNAQGLLRLWILWVAGLLRGFAYRGFSDMCSFEQQRVLRLSCLWAAEVLIPFASCQDFCMFFFERERVLWLCCFVGCCIKSLDALPIVEVFRCTASNGKGSCG